jgi:hypothetical protein
VVRDGFGVSVGESRDHLVLERQEIAVGRNEEAPHGFLEKVPDVTAAKLAMVDADGEDAETDRATGRFVVFKGLRWQRATNELVSVLHI